MSKFHIFSFPKSTNYKLVLIIVGITLTCLIATSIILVMILKNSQIVNDKKANPGGIEVVQKSISGMHFIAYFEIKSNF